MIPESLEKINQQEQIDASTAGWSKVPAITRHHIAKPAFLLKPERIPDSEGNRLISVDLNSNATLHDVMSILGDQGLSSIITDETVASKQISINKFKGTLKQLLNGIAMSMDVSFDWRDGTLLVGATSDYMLSMTQDAEMLKKVEAEIGKLGAKNVSSSIPTGTVSFSSSDRTRFSIEQYMNRVIKNAATINMQIAVISVTLDNERTTGIDWSNLSTTFRGGIPAAAAAATSGTSATGTAGTTPTTAVAATVTEQVVRAGLKGAMDSTGLGLAIDTGDFSMKMLLSALSKYGNAKTDQNLLLKTLSGNTVKIKSGSTVPYVSGVSTTLGGGGYSSTSSTSVSSSNTGNGITNTTSSGVMGGAQTAKAESGITVDVTPVYDADTSVVTLAVNLKLSTITGFIELKAGNQIGSLSQPSTQDQSFNDVAKLQAGDTILLGGLILEHSEDKRNSLVPIESLPIGKSDEKNRREALFIVIRPTSDVYEFSDTKADSTMFETRATQTPISNNPIIVPADKNTLH